MAVERAMSRVPLLGDAAGRRRGALGVAAVAVGALALVSVLLLALPQSRLGAVVSRLQVLAEGGAADDRAVARSGVEFIGDVPVDGVLDAGLGMERPAADVAHAFSQDGSVYGPCNKATDPDCQNSISPFVDKARTQALLLPWYEVASEGDGMGPESVSYWRLPPKSQLQQAQQAVDEQAAAAADRALKTGGASDASQGTSGGAQSLGGFPAPPNTFQEPTVWKGDHVLNGGNKEWAEEDAAVHAYNMQKWRNKILDTQIERQRRQWRLMHTGSECSCGHARRGCACGENARTALRPGAARDDTETRGSGKGAAADKRKRRISDNLRVLADDADKALALLDSTEGGDDVVSTELRTSHDMQSTLERVVADERAWGQARQDVTAQNAGQGVGQTEASAEGEAKTPPGRHDAAATP